jgi:hypothetical protein
VSTGLGSGIGASRAAKCKTLMTGSCAFGSKLSVRLATPEETTIFEQAAESAEPADDMVLAYLVELDGVRS